MKSRPGALAGIVSGVTSRSHYVWAGATYQRYAEGSGQRRPDLLFYTFAYGYRPESWRKDKGWDWRVFGECTGERAGSLERPRRRSRQPKQSGVRRADDAGRDKNYAVSGGVQFAVYQNVGPAYPRERVRVGVNFTWFF